MLKKITRDPAAMGEQIYEGHVYALDGRQQPLFRYERRVDSHAAHMTSTHVTFDPSGDVVVVQSAEHTPAYALSRADMVHGQTGIIASVVVADGRATFTLKEGDRESRSHETVQEPVVAGPTMFGFILAHWEQLQSGASIPFRFAVLERKETLRFVLDQVSQADGRTTIRMKPTNLLVRLAVASTYFQFDTASRHILEYTGRVPPLEQVNNRLKTLDARVHYSFVAPTFH